MRLEAALRSLRRERGGGVRVAIRPGVSDADLGAAFGVSPRTVRGIVERLEAEGARAV
jgi:hypothetical protein